MKEQAVLRLITLQVAVFLVLCLDESHSGPLDYFRGSLFNGKRINMLPEISPTSAPQPFLPFLAPSPLAPFINKTTSKLSGLCMLNFTEAESLIRTTSINCWTVFAPLVANVICCPQLDATLVVLLGQFSKVTGFLALNGTHAKHCLSDMHQMLESQGASDKLNHICSLHPSNLTKASCPVKDVTEFEGVVNSSLLLAACEKIDPVKECCDQVCQNAILDAARKIAEKASNGLSMEEGRLSDNSTIVRDCRNIVLRWLAGKLTIFRAKETLRTVTNCNVNRVCPLVFPHMRHVVNSCQNESRNQTACCHAMESYVSHLQKQTLITNLQALDCATSLGMKLQKSNITRDVYSLCHVSLKDFSLQVGYQVSGCLLPSLPSDAVYDTTLGVSFTCDLNDNIPAPWPSSSQLSSSLCDKTVRIPALPAAASGQQGLYNKDAKHYTRLVSLLVLMMLL